MLTVIRKPNKNQKIRSEEMSITAKVVDILSYKELTANYTSEMLMKLNENINDTLGENGRELYFEVIVKVTYAKKNSEYKKDELVNLTWDEFQRCKILDK